MKRVPYILWKTCKQQLKKTLNPKVKKTRPKTKLVKSKPTKSKSTKSKSTKAKPAKAKPAKAKPAKAKPAKAKPAKAKSVSKSAKSAKSKSTNTKSAKPKSAKSKSPKSKAEPTKSILSDKDLADIGSMRDLRSAYYKGYAFPAWAIQKAKDNWDKVMKGVRVFYSKNEPNKNLVRDVVRDREPVNIEMKQFFDPDVMAEHFGPTESFYTRHYDIFNNLAPNVAVYTPTYVDYKGNTNTFIHVLNSVGYAFDDEDQPDYKHFIGDPDITKKMNEKYERIFRLMVACAKEVGLTKIVVSLVGADNFAKKYDAKEMKGPMGENERKAFFQRTVWAPAFIKVHKETVKSNPDIKWAFMGAEDKYGNPSTALQIVQKYKAYIKNLGWFPDILDDPWVDLDTTLFINAWDPHSVAGNGNAKDQSLDGQMGRRTNIGVNSTMMTNSHMKFIPVDA